MKDTASNDPPPLVEIGPRVRAYVMIFGRRYDLRRPDEGTVSDQKQARMIGQRLAVAGQKKNLTDADMTNMTRDSRELMSLLVPNLDEATIRFLRFSEMAAIASAWTQAYGAERPE